MIELWRELRTGARGLHRRPGFSLIAVITLGLGIGANTAMFSLTNAVLLRPLPYRDPERLVKLWETNQARGGEREMTSVSNLEDWRRESVTLEGIAAWQRPTSLTLSRDIPAVTIRASMVSENYFSLLGVEPRLGRAFGREETLARTVLISDGFWRRQLGAAPAVVGSALQLEGADFNVIGVMPADFVSPAGEADVWLPITMRPNNIDRGQTYLQTLARLKPGVTLLEAQADLGRVASGLSARFPGSNRARGIEAAPLMDEVVGGVRQTLLFVMGAVGLVLFIACANVANLFLLRNAERRGEMAIRAALGASRGRIVRQLLLEASLLASLGGGLGVVVAAMTLAAVKTFGLGLMPRLHEVGIDGATLTFTLAVAAFTALACGVAPSRNAGSRVVMDGGSTLGSRGTSDRGGQEGLRRGLVVTQVALTLILLTGATLLTRSVVRLLNVDPGFRPEEVLIARMSLGDRYESDERKTAYFRDITERLRGLPGVISAGAVTVLPMNPFGIDFDVPYHREDEAEPVLSAAAKARFRAATPGYFEAIGMRLDKGRGFHESDRRETRRVVIVNQALAETVWPGRSPVGETLRFFWSDWQTYEVVGLVANAKSYGLAEESRPELFVPNAQIPYGVMNIVVRARDPRAIAGPVTAEILAHDPHQPVHSVAVMSDLIRDSLARERFTLVSLGAFALLALILATVGLYSVVSYATAQRRREIALRVALGATPRDVLRLTLGSGARLSALGVVAGVSGSLALGRVMESLLFEVQATDPATLLTTSALLLTTSLGATWIPARRAARIDPNRVLREG